MNRRDFLHPRHAATAAGHVLGAVSELQSATEAPPAPEEIALLRLGWRAMATGWEILVPFDTPCAAAAGQAAFELLDALEDQLTVYRDTSEVCHLNRTAAADWVPVEEGLFGLLELAARLTHDTEGGFDITAHALIQAWGFFRGPRQVPPPAERTEAMSRVGMHHVRLRQADRAAQRPQDQVGGWRAARPGGWRCCWPSS